MNEDVAQRVKYVSDLTVEFVDASGLTATQAATMVQLVLLTQIVDNTAMLVNRLQELEETLSANQLAEMAGQGGMQ